ncbi:prephenate dehydrogenase [Robertkochia marina]|uniref:Prephenate dehydrogenase n=1 Tax=Robertkochia marina TaxID=1227945 RepID=A0A4S3M2K1_9FLAO|nr:prephenate dehydrogenase [Robertkochia marina]THD68909.1 prephenate dehydrogenase [Robertkochia marina]TRZ41153.1 prephenate dehydrogenase [Robertkochia marina]
MKISIIGLGLIGGSIALDLKEVGSYEIFGYDNSPDHLDQALAMSIIDAPGNAQSLKEADVVVLAIPVNAALREVSDLLDTIGENTLLLDVGSTKTLICDKVRDHRNRRNFLATHPIAGTEFSGPSAAIKGLFAGKTNIVCEVEKTAFKLQERAMEIFRHLGMRIRYMDPKAHDKHIAYVSHLSHISSFMLGKTVIEKEKNERDIFDMAGSGFESTVRLAKSSPDMWTPIFEHNRENVLETLEGYIENLRHFMELLKDENYKAIYQEMDNTNRIKDILKGITINAI